MRLTGLKKARELHGFTQAGLADSLGVTRGAVARWEIGEREPDLETLRRLAALLNTTVDDLIAPAGDEATNQPSDWSAELPAQPMPDRRAQGDPDTCRQCHRPRPADTACRFCNEVVAGLTRVGQDGLKMYGSSAPQEVQP